MADFDFEPPSFSLGFDLDLHSEPQPTPRPDPLSQPAKRSSAASNLGTIEEDDDFESPVRVSDPQVSGPSQSFKRLRRGPTVRKVELEDVRCNADDEIEDFSSDEDWPRGSLPTNSTCSSSKSSLRAQSVLTSESGSQWTSIKKKEVSKASASATTKTNGSNVIFPKLTVSPLRRFQLIDSDSDCDDPSLTEQTFKESPHVISSSKDKQSDFSFSGTKKASVGKYQNEDLWKDFCSSEKSSRIPTPAFDEVFEEYFTSVKNKGKAQIDTNDNDPSNGTKLDGATHPPAHSYFFHKDSRIQKLVRDRLPHFFPLGVGNNQEYRQLNASVIDYMGQFGHEDNSKQTNGRPNVEKSSTRSRKSAKKTQVDKDTENWVNPRSSAGAGLPKNAGNRRVQAVSKTIGHWFTGSDGRRVYVNKNGQELTGKMAYVNYKKENGTGFKKSKKKTAAKKKSAPKKK